MKYNMKLKMAKSLIGLVTLLTSLLVFENANADMEKSNLKKATFAGGCFWCMQPAFDELKGVEDTYVGYSGGDVKNPTYEQIGTKETGHFEAIEIVYHPEQISYKQLLEAFIRNIDPLDPLGQFADKGPQYQTAIFYRDEAEKKEAEEFFKEFESKDILDGEIQVKILPYKNFFMAEDYHQDYYKKNPTRYNMYKYGSGRVRKLEEIWGEI